MVKFAKFLNFLLKKKTEKYSVVSGGQTRLEDGDWCRRLTPGLEAAAHWKLLIISGAGNWSKNSWTGLTHPSCSYHQYQTCNTF